jgi:hypothetical protein
VDVLQRILDVAGLAMHAVLRVDLQPPPAGIISHEFVHSGGAVARLGAVVLGEIDPDGDSRIAKLQMDGLVFLVIRIRQEDRRQLVEREHAVVLRVIDAPRLRCREERRVVGLAVP